MPEVGFYPSRRLRKRRNDYFAYVNLWPFTGIVLGLLFIIMLEDRNQPHHGVGVDLPTVGHPAQLPWAKREDAMKVAVTRDGILYFGSAKSTDEDLPREIAARVARGAERRVYLMVDARARYGDVKRALDCVREARIENVSFLAYKKRG